MNTKTATNEKTTYTSTGVVLGNLWGGGKGGYSAKHLENTSKEALIKEAEKMLADGSLDGGMGFESLTAALLDIDTITTVDIDGKTFTHREGEIHIIGDPSAEDQAFLEDTFYEG